MGEWASGRVGEAGNVMVVSREADEMTSASGSEISGASRWMSQEWPGRGVG